MELRGCSRFHFITVIRGGQAIKLPNLARGFPKLKLMDIEEIYSSSDSNCHDSLAKCPPKVDRSMALPYGYVEVKTEVKSECIEEENGVDFGAMTLRQIKDICKSHKRKASRSVDLTTVKQEDDDLQHEVDVLDLKETLGSWKRKVLMKRKAKKKCIVNSNSMSPTTNTIGVRLMDTTANLDSLDVSSKICMPLSVKVEDAELDYSQQQARSLPCNVDPGNLISDTVRTIEKCSPDQDLNASSEYLQSGYTDQLYLEHLVQPVSIGKSACCLNQVSYEHLDHSELQNPLISGIPDMKEIIKVESLVDIGDQPLVSLEARREEKAIDLMACEELGLHDCDSSDIQIDFSHYSCPLQTPPDKNPSSKVLLSVMASNSDCEIADIEAMGDNEDNEKFLRRAATNCNSMEKFDNNTPSVSSMASLDNIILPVEDQQYSVLDSTTEEVPVSPMDLKSYCHDIEFINNGEASRSVVDSLDPGAKAIRKNSVNCSVEVQDKECLSVVNSVESLHNVTSVVVEQPSSILDEVITPQTCSLDIQPCKATDQQMGSAGNEGHCENKFEQQSPARLLSSRKTISPNSKERLRKDMNCAEMQDDTQILSCREKLLFEQMSVDTLTSRSNLKKARIILTSKRPEDLRKTEIRGNSRQTLKKGKYEKKLSLIKGTVNGPHASSTCSSALSCSQNAIAFSQRQMIDTERIVMKLLSELHLMKETVVDTFACSTSRCNTDKARVAVESVKKVEDATKKWLSMMSRDCNRFCKIMEIIESNGASPVKSNDDCSPDLDICQNIPVSQTNQEEHKLSPPKSAVHKDRKITFADEAGESLCHVRVL